MIWFSADYHLGHQNIIKYCKRPFQSVLEMDTVILHNLFSSVRKGDTLYFLGDLTFKAGIARKFLSRCDDHGLQVRLIIGNHDKWIKDDEFQSRQIDHLSTIIPKGQVIVMCHYAMRVWDRSHYGSWQLYGHSHGIMPPKGLQHDVGVDNNGFMPLSFDNLKDIMAARGQGGEMR